MSLSFILDIIYENVYNISYFYRFKAYQFFNLYLYLSLYNILCLVHPLICMRKFKHSQYSIGLCCACHRFSMQLINIINMRYKN